ncbi:MAG: hypothetical protein U0586_09430, partial [Candidatus Brocadiaceae bacterium]
MSKKYTMFIGLFCMIVFLAGCASSRLKTDYGNSHRLVIANQTLNPEAGKNLDPVCGIDSQAATKSVERYRKSFEKTEAPPIYTIGAVGGLG